MSVACLTLSLFGKCFASDSERSGVFCLFINQIYLPGKYYKNKKKKRYTKSTIIHFPGGKYKLTEVVLNLTVNFGCRR